MHSASPPSGAPQDIGSAAFFIGMIVLLATRLGVALPLSAMRLRFSGMSERGNTAWTLVAYALAMAVSIHFLGVWLVTMLALLLLALCQTYWPKVSALIAPQNA
ncbi:hypothetical protein ACT3R7_02820 [Halomonas sp. AOP43-A1-21]